MFRRRWIHFVWALVGLAALALVLARGVKADPQIRALTQQQQNEEDDGNTSDAEDDQDDDVEGDLYMRDASPTFARAVVFRSTITVTLAPRETFLETSTPPPRA